MELMELCRKSKEVSRKIGMLDTEKKNRALYAAADALIEHAERLLEENAKDLVRARANHMPESLLDRLMLDEGRIGQIAAGMRQVAALEDPVGEVLSMKKRPNGLLLGQKRVPIGVVGMIYEARPNVTADAFSLCFKTGNAVILKGGSDAMYSNISMVSIIQAALEEQEIPKDAVLLITDPSHEAAAAFMKMNAYVDVLIPRGGRGLIQTVVNQATIPVIETGTGNCHIYVDESADFQMAADIICNAKTQRIGVCNACESLVIHKRIAESFLPCLSDALNERGVEIRGDQNVCRILGPKRSRAALEEDWGREYLDWILSVKTVSSLDEAIAHINRYNTGHSEAIITKDYANAQRFLDEIDAACVYVNASTRFSDGFEFGFGAEIGISTQKLHARGPMGLNALTSTKYIIYGNGQIRP
ncbi:glutamate-5-semialdehyde dehydrogenase [Cuneatibacter sp. NSJ-177]|uniref:glutamate-5-semialdehyde dehydrogenase n=1 Tax=Cuneatibacter sp. NSJ-177 TaxID=2931401 RepID=UPI001FD49286|nr:glutamate-5-semialdehyde dehydrogenase [Cuneatibacter sp. NSJ-177]MCJ7833871.1 glutamate-5-semialdehyde dehydrogenase [Cuneatibacter sp. NSJ-177]